MTGKDKMTGKDRAITVAVPAGAAGQRLDAVLAAAIAGLSRSRLKALIVDSRVARAGVTVRQPSQKVAAGDVFTVTLPEPAPAVPQAQAIALTILHEDADVIVIDKPPGLVVHPAPGNPDRTLVNALIAHCGAGLTGIGGVRRPGIVHRLDKDTSGLMVAAKTAAAHESLTGQFAARTVDRAYRAIVWGVPSPPAGEIAAPIGRNPRNRKKMAVVARGKPALTRYATERRFGPAGAPLASLLRCTLATGRTHQIRVHLAHIGHPIIGDPVYGDGAKRRRGHRRAALSEAARAAVAAMPRQALHAFRLGFDHPATGERLGFETLLPKDMQAFVDNLESL